MIGQLANPLADPSVFSNRRYSTTTSTRRRATLVPYQVQLSKHCGEKYYALLVLEDNVVDDAVLLRLIRVHDKVAFHVAFHFLERLTTMLRK
jgi:hypothetical protein